MTLAGCQSAADRMYECEAQGVSRDACYVAEKNRSAAIGAAATKQAMENANDLYGAKGTETNKPKAHHHKQKSWQAEDDSDSYGTDEGDNDQW
ncbi:TPA: hypothetical protein LU109_003575 [Enterobacter hormaechei subsp. xiangfangensis]|nr:hypothetical protein [Enterobacter hormaechei subsp. xiangfangensis]